MCVWGKTKKESRGRRIQSGPSEECEAAEIHFRERGGGRDRGKDTDRQADGKKNTDTLTQRETQSKTGDQFDSLREKSKKRRDIFNQGLLEVLIKTYCKKDHIKRLSLNKKCLGVGTMSVSVCLCVYKPVAKTLCNIVNTQNKDDTFCPSSDCLPPSFSSSLPFLEVNSLSPHQTGKIGIKATSCLLSVIMRGWVRSTQASPAPCPQCHHTQT